MPCYHLLQAFQRLDEGPIAFYQKAGYDKELALPCGQCVGCRLERSRQWAMRCMHEASLHKNNAFATLTYDKNTLPERGQLQHTDFQKFMKRLRKEYAPIRVRFYMCGEYGEQRGRPHYHACLFGIDWEDKEYYSKNENDDNIYTSKILTKLWGKGDAKSGDVTFQSAAYVARYCMQKITGFNAKYHYARHDEKGEYQQVPEYNKMSLKPGIGAPWLEKYKTDVYPQDYVIIKGQKTLPPKYYDKILEKQEPETYEQIKETRIENAYERRADNTTQRLTAKEIVAIAKINLLKRKEIK